MNRAKIFIAFTFLLAFGVCVLAQDKTPKIVWENVQKEYEDFNKIKPIIKLQNAKYLLWNSYDFKKITLLRFDEKEKEWIEGNYILDCGLIPRQNNIILKEAEPLDYFFFSGQFFALESSKGYFFISSDQKKYSVNGKYKIRFYYGFEPDKIEFFSDSPEFFIDGKYPANN